MILSASKRQSQSFLLFAQLSRDGLLYVEAMNDKITPVIGTTRERARKQARCRAKRVAHWTRGKTRPIDCEAWPQRQSRIERAPCCIESRDDGLAQKTQ